MASRSVTVWGDSELSTIFVQNGGTSGNRLVMEAGDTLTVYHASYSSISSNIAVTGFSTAQWTSATQMSIPRNSVNNRTVKTSPTAASINLTVSFSGYTSGTIYLSIVDSADTTPDSFTFNSIAVANPGATYELGSFLVTGINVGVTMTASGTATTKTKIGVGGTYTTLNKTVYNNNRVYVQGTAPTQYGTSTTATVTIGGVSHTATITTPTAPVGTKIPIGVSSGAISLDDVRKLFGPSSAPGVYGTASMSNYYRNGTYVPNITTGTPNNNNIPTSGTIDLADFYDSCTTLFFDDDPTNKTLNLSTVGQGNSGNLAWYPNTDWTMGFGPDMAFLVEYQIFHEVIIGEIIGSLTSVTLTANGTNYDLLASQADITTGWGTGSIGVTVSAPQNCEAFVVGTITLTARHRVYTSYTRSIEFQYNVSVYGP